MSKKKDLDEEDVINTSLSKVSESVEVQHLLDSGAIPANLDTAEKIMTVVQMGKELGMQPMTAITNIHIIKGRTVISSSMLGAMLKKRLDKNGKPNPVEYYYTKDYHTEDDGKIVTEIEFEFISQITNRPKSVKFSISWGQMELAGYTTKDNWLKYPKEMMRARCLAYAVRALFPEVLLGVYTDMEIVDAFKEEQYETTLTEDGDPIIINKEDFIDVN